MVNGSISTYGFARLLACLSQCCFHTHTDIHSIGLMLVPSIPLRYRCCFVSSPLQNMFVFTQTTIFIRLTEHLCRSKSKIDIMLSTLHMIVFTLSSHTRNQTTDDRKKFKREHTPHCTTDNIAQSSNSLPISVTLYSVFPKRGSVVYARNSQFCLHILVQPKIELFLRSLFFVLLLLFFRKKTV